MSIRDEQGEFPQTELKQIQMLQAALMVGPLMFLLVVPILGQAQPAPTPAEEMLQDGIQQAYLLSGVLAAVAAGSYTAVAFVGRAMLAAHFRERKATGPLAAGEVEDALGVFRNARMVQMALFEGVALFGVTVLYLMTLNGVAAEQPWVWINAIYTLVLLGYGGATFPSQRSIERTLNDLVRSQGDA